MHDWSSAHVYPFPAANSWQRYLIDAMERSILFVDVLRQRGEEEVEITSRPMATVLRFESELLMRGDALSRPINYNLLRILPPAGVVTDPCLRPVVVVDPRSGQGPGIAGFQADSEIGDALRAGHPVYFIAFSSKPELGQQFVDVVQGQVAFFDYVVRSHPDALPPFAIGNSQAGYQTLMVAMLRPDLFGPCLLAGSPMSYWQGEHGKNPMRYVGGLLGGGWMTAFLSDLNMGKFDGSWLIMNFDLLSPSDWLWARQYRVYTQIDTDKRRYLDFERWWGDFIELNGDEVQYLVDELFVGDKLTRNQLTARDGKVFDIRNVTSPILVFASLNDNISPPAQALGWIVDLYLDVDEIRAQGQTIVYCLSQKVGHLDLFISSAVGAKEDQAFVQLVDVIDYLPPGLYEMVLTPRAACPSHAGYGAAQWVARFQARDLDDIRALGRNSLDDDRAFAAVAKLSQHNLSLYQTFMQPWVRLLANQTAVDMAKAVNPLRWSYRVFANSNPWMKSVQSMAEAVAGHRHPVEDDNPFLAMQTQLSQQIVNALDGFQAVRDHQAEQSFFAFYGSPVVQALFGLPNDCDLRSPPVASPKTQAMRLALKKSHAKHLQLGGFNEALTRAVLYITEADCALDQRCAYALNMARLSVMQLSFTDFKHMVRQQFFVLGIAQEEAIDALLHLVPDAKRRQALFDEVKAIASADDPGSVEELKRLEYLAQVLGCSTATLLLHTD